ncbi:MAG TPA: 7-cyano-7-deazaguanine synthase QueC [Alphaproteobacteria bacterium]|nr:7-cyano-7-deazaguanine synthase QueC [Alphaproteobacteria bacterium]
MDRAKAVVLLSGGLDSATALALAGEAGFLPYALSFRYGQRHAVEAEAARRIARAQGAREHRVLDIAVGALGGSTLTGEGCVPKGRAFEAIGREIPSTYVPARNTIFLAYALGWAEVLGAFDIFFGANALDYSGYPDCRPEYIAAFERLANLATKAAVEGQGRYRIHAPLIGLTKAEIIAEGLRLGIDYGATVSCYDADDEGRACGECDSCRLRLKGFAELGVSDPAPYRSVASP